MIVIQLWKIQISGIFFIYAKNEGYYQVAECIRMNMVCIQVCINING